MIFLTAKEAMDALEALLNEPNVTTSMIDDILKDVPVIDTNANSNAITYLYSGMGDAMNQYIGNPSIRMIDNTAMSEVLNSQIFKDVANVACSYEGIDYVKYAYDGVYGTWAKPL